MKRNVFSAAGDCACKAWLLVDKSTESLKAFFQEPGLMVCFS